MVLRRPERSVECSDSEKKMSACADQNHAPSLTCVRLEFTDEGLEKLCFWWRVCMEKIAYIVPNKKWITEVRSWSMSCNCMTRTSQQECRSILEQERWKELLEYIFASLVFWLSILDWSHMVFLFKGAAKVFDVWVADGGRDVFCCHVSVF